jgi:hypothetical protein
MGKVETYSSLEEKGRVFEQTVINSKKDLDEKFKLYRKNVNKNLIYRGCKEARYKLYNKAQREWINKDLSNHGFKYTDFIKKIINNARHGQETLLENFYSAFGIPTNDLIILGFLQHYGAPTTLLDWTYSFNNSLFFATEDLKFYESNLDIDNYFSVYIIDNSGKKIVDFIDSIKEETNSYVSKEGPDDFPKYLTKYMLELMSELSYNNLNSKFLAILPGYSKNGIAHEISEFSFKFFYNQQNLNIINQQGLFIFNASMDKPLEFYFRNEIIMIGKSKSYNIPKICCLDIHKSLYDYTQKQLNDCLPFPINKDFIYPKEKSIALKAYQQFLNFDNFKNE